MTRKDRSNSAPWVVTVRLKGKEKEIRMPGGLHEPEAIRGACMRSGGMYVRIRRLAD